MKFKFSLEKVLKQRRIQADLAEKDFLEAQANLNLEIQKRDVMVQVKDESLHQRSSIVQNKNSWAIEVEQINIFVQGQDLRIKQQNLRLTEFEKLVESKREILRNAMVEVKIIERLKEKKFEEFKKEMNRQEQNEIDELTVLRFSRTENLIKGSHEDGI